MARALSRALHLIKKQGYQPVRVSCEASERPHFRRVPSDELEMAYYGGYPECRGFTFSERSQGPRAQAPGWHWPERIRFPMVRTGAEPAAEPVLVW